MSSSSLSFRINPREITFVGHDLSRPECILAERNGTLWISDDRGGVTRRDPSGVQHVIGSIRGTPNGLAMTSTLDLLVADIGNGIVYRLDRKGRHEVVLDQLGTQPLGSVNFVYADAHGTIWITVSTRTQPRKEAIARPIPDGYLLRVDAGGPHVVATGLCFPNELRIDRHYRYVYVAESARGRVVRMPLLPDGSLGPQEVFGPSQLFAGAIVDGIAFDELDGLWVTEVTRNGIYRIAADGSCECLIEDPEGKMLLFPASVTFAGHDLRTVLVGSIKAKRLACFRSPIPGTPLAHWHRNEVIEGSSSQ
ncbi:SMP-30/gluconolactonase/LRE family protein [Burkholderia cenocepacia]|jgi:sugar lactone lactonase YvrE|uniref:SMP-30/gluconolactonase/LRE family protein n=1 Tax=Burkholderia cenocepacia TaxID=95486 RepID=UPI00163ADDE4|nr:SMP-30/gluconolactonase/LRE family protein [Burkholderia cenocepacia]